jgi:hypothetical protein
MRSSFPFLLACLLAPASLAAQAAPPPDAPFSQHVAHLLTLARAGFAEVRGPATYVPSTTLATTLASTYAMRFRGADAASGITVNSRWNVMHETRLPVTDGANVHALWAAAADSIDRLVADGWRRPRLRSESPAQASFAWWSECANGARSLSLRTNASYEPPALYLIVYKYDAPCSN